MIDGIRIFVYFIIFIFLCLSLFGAGMVIGEGIGRLIKKFKQKLKENKKCKLT